MSFFISLINFHPRKVGNLKMDLKGSIAQNYQARYTNPGGKNEKENENTEKGKKFA